MVDVQEGAAMTIRPGFKFAGRWRAILPPALLLVLIVPLLFKNLDTVPIRIWDESRLAVNAVEMHLDGSWLVTHFDGEPDMWNTKPPLLIWQQAGLMKLLGPGELAVRLPSAFAALITCLALFWFARCFLGDALLGFVTVLVLLSSPGYAGFHAARTGDYDAPLTLFTTVYCLAFFIYMERKSTPWLYAFFVSLALAILTKGVGAVIFLPAIALYVLVRREVKGLLTCRHFYLGIAVVMVVTAGYYGARELSHAGYLKAVFQNELGGRYLQSIEGHDESPFYYVKNLVAKRMPFWASMSLMAMIMGLFGRQWRLGSPVRFLTLLSVFYLLAISRSETKCGWYDVPIYPFLSIMAAALVVFVAEGVARHPWSGGRWGRNVILAVIFALLFRAPMTAAVDRVRNPENDPGFYMIGYCLQDAQRGELDVDGLIIPGAQYSPQNTFYIKILQAEGVDVVAKEWSDLAEGDRVLVTKRGLKDYLEPQYLFDLELELERGQVFVIRGRRG